MIVIKWRCSGARLGYFFFRLADRKPVSRNHVEISLVAAPASMPYSSGLTITISLMSRLALSGSFGRPIFFGIRLATPKIRPSWQRLYIAVKSRITTCSLSMDVFSIGAVVGTTSSLINSSQNHRLRVEICPTKHYNTRCFVAVRKVAPRRTGFKQSCGVKFLGKEAHGHGLADSCACSRSEWIFVKGQDSSQGDRQRFAAARSRRAPRMGEKGASVKAK